MTAIGAPEEIGSPSVTKSWETVPALWAVISFSIFIASMTAMSAPSSTSAPCSTATRRTVPWSGEMSVSPPPPPPPERSDRRGGRRAPPLPAAAPGAEAFRGDGTGNGSGNGAPRARRDAGADVAGPGADRH